jgi:hypothetical protein
MDERVQALASGTLGSESERASLSVMAAITAVGSLPSCPSLSLRGTTQLCSLLFNSLLPPHWGLAFPQASICPPVNRTKYLLPAHLQ